MGNLEIRDLNQSFPREDGSQLVVLDHLSFDVKDKEFVCILGSSGCGKTTLLRLIAGLDSAREGSIILDSEEIKGPNPKVGFVFQEYSLFPWRNVIDNIAFGLEMNGIGTASLSIIWTSSTSLSSKPATRPSCPAGCGKG
jgi:NitT/TauT family transport system ATP-binding protein